MPACVCVCVALCTAMNKWYTPGGGTVYRDALTHGVSGILVAVEWKNYTQELNGMREQRRREQKKKHTRKMQKTRGEKESIETTQM